MNEIQRAYVEAKAVEDALRAEFNRRTAHLWAGDVTEADIEQIATEEARVDEELGIWVANDARLEAERRLVEWAHGIVKTSPRYEERRADIEHVFASYRRFPHLHPELIDICLRLDA